MARGTIGTHGTAGVRAAHRLAVGSPRQFTVTKAITDMLHASGCPIERPWLYLMFFEIVPLPEYALTVHGVVEFKSLQYMDPVLEV